MAKSDLPDEIRINRTLRGVKTRPFHDTFTPRRDRPQMRRSGREARFHDIFIGFHNVGPFKKLFGKKTQKVFSELRVATYTGEGYMWIDNERSRLMINKKYLKNGAMTDLYLDALHELVHIKQHMNGIDLWDERYEYVDRPTEVEAYKAAVWEARRIGLSKKEIRKHLHSPRLSKEHNKRLYENCGV